MRRTILAASVALLLMLVSASAALAVDLPSSRHPDGSPPGDRSRVKALRGPMHFVPLGVKLAGTAVVDGHTYRYDGISVPSTYVYWEAPFETTWEWGETSTDINGAYAFSGLPAAAGTGYLYAEYPTSPWFAMWRSQASWTDPGTTTFDWRPGVVPVELARGGVWDGWYYATTYLYGNDGLSYTASATDITDPLTPSSYSDHVTGESYAGSGTYSLGATYFWIDQGLEYPVTQNVMAGTSTGSWVSVAQTDAQRITVTTPYWASGKPGTVAKVRHWNYPAGWPLDYYGYADSPSRKPFKDYADSTTTGADPFTKSLTIPKTAPAGYQYRIGVYNTAGVLQLETPFQVCTLKSTKTAVRKGATVKLSGVVPTQNHWGSTAGKRKYVYLFKRTTSAAPPKGDPIKAGWKFVKRVRCDGYGKYQLGTQTIPRSTWFIVLYEGDDWYWPAYTSVLKVRGY